jgi:cytosine/adenosine deaminase-related metal-dependent hydrolase
MGEPPLIYRARCVLPIDGPPIDNGEVLVIDGEIAAIGQSISLERPAEPVTDLGNCALLPGFVNTHSHVDYTMSRNAVDGLNFWDWISAVGFSRNRLPDPATIRLSALLGAAELALSGVTTVADCSFTGLAADALASVGQRGIVYFEMFGQSMGTDYAQVFHRKLDEVQQAQSEASSLVKMGISPHAIYTSNRDLLKLCAETCAQLNIPVALHLAETSAETDYSMRGSGPLADWRRSMGYEPMTSGLTPTRYLQDVGLLQSGVSLAHCVHVSEDEIELIASSGASVAHCPRSNAYLGAGIAPLTGFISAGASIGLGTDSAGSCMRLDFFDEMRSALALHRAVPQDASVLTAKGVLELATIGGAAALGLEDRIGTLSVGKRADMIAIDLSRTLPGEDIHLAVLSRSPADVRLALVDGVEIVREGKPAGLDIDACRSELIDRLEHSGIG